MTYFGEDSFQATDCTITMAGMSVAVEEIQSSLLNNLKQATLTALCQISNSLFLYQTAV